MRPGFCLQLSCWVSRILWHTQKVCLPWIQIWTTVLSFCHLFFYCFLYYLVMNKRGVGGHLSVQTYNVCQSAHAHVLLVQVYLQQYLLQSGERLHMCYEEKEMFCLWVLGNKGFTNHYSWFCSFSCKGRRCSEARRVWVGGCMNWCVSCSLKVMTPSRDSHIVL